jgi:hypothetical protein
MYATCSIHIHPYLLDSMVLNCGRGYTANFYIVRPKLLLQCGCRPQFKIMIER